MKLHEVLKLKSRSSKRVGRGVGSGKGKTAGRGTKGQKARGKIPLAFTGGLAFFKKLPKKRGSGNRKVSDKPKLIDISKLEVFKVNSIIDSEQLIKAKLINENDTKFGIKILAEGEITKALTIKLPVSKKVREKIEKAGGKVEHV